MWWCAHSIPLCTPAQKLVGCSFVVGYILTQPICFFFFLSRAQGFEMSWLDFSSFATYCKLISNDGEHQFAYHDLDRVWICVNCHTNTATQHHVRFLSRFEFLEALVRIALVKYTGVGPYASVEMLLNAHIVPYFKHMDANIFRRIKVTTPRLLSRFCSGMYSHRIRRCNERIKAMTLLHFFSLSLFFLFFFSVVFSFNRQNF